MAGRYTVDVWWLLVFPSLLCMGYAYKKSLKYGTTATTVVRRLSFAAIGISCFITFAWGRVGESNYIWRHNPVVIRFISDLLMFF